MVGILKVAMATSVEHITPIQVWFKGNFFLSPKTVSSQNGRTRGHVTWQDYDREPCSHQGYRRHNNNAVVAVVGPVSIDY